MAEYVKKAKLSPSREKGATAVEYAVILALFAAVVVGAISLVNARVNDSFDGVVNELAGTPGG